MYSCKKDLEEKIMKLLIFTLKFHLKGFTAKNTYIIHKYEVKHQKRHNYIKAVKGATKMVYER